MRICIDPGHSGPIEPGVCSGGATEAAVNLEISKLTERMLKKAGHQVKLTRTDNVDNDWLTWRVNVAWAFDSDIFISIHCNGFKDPAAHGTETFYYPTSENGHLLALCLQTALVDNCHTTDRGVKTKDDWPVLRDTACPAVLVELAFLTHDKEREMLTDPFSQRIFASAIVAGVNRYAEGGPLFRGRVGT